MSRYVVGVTVSDTFALGRATRPRTAGCFVAKRAPLKRLWLVDLRVKACRRPAGIGPAERGRKDTCLLHGEWRSLKPQIPNGPTIFMNWEECGILWCFFPPSWGGQMSHRRILRVAHYFMSSQHAMRIAIELSFERYILQMHVSRCCPNLSHIESNYM